MQEISKHNLALRINCSTASPALIFVNQVIFFNQLMKVMVAKLYEDHLLSK